MILRGDHLSLSVSHILMSKIVSVPFFSYIFNPSHTIPPIYGLYIPPLGILCSMKNLDRFPFVPALCLESSD